MPKSSVLLSVLEELEKYSDKEIDISNDLQTIIIHTFKLISESFDIIALENKLKGFLSVDSSSLLDLIRLVRFISIQKEPINIGELTFDFEKEIESLEKFINELIEKAPKMDSSDIAVNIDFAGEHILMNILICAAYFNIRLPEIEGLVKNKLDILDDNAISQIWGSILSDFGMRKAALQVVEDIIDPDFLKPTDFNSTRKKIARYSISLKPRLIVERFKENKYQYSTNSIAALRLIALNESSLLMKFSYWESEILSAVARLVLFWQESRFITTDVAVLSAALGVSKDGILFTGSELNNAKREKSNLNSNAYAFLNIKKVLNIILAYAVESSPVETALKQHKLGLEVMCPSNLLEFESKDELLLQRELCKFLIERNIPCYGIKFGSNEIDLFVQDFPDSFVVETKLYREGQTINEASIRKNITQLLTYLDQNQKRGKGVLVIYNLTDWLISSPKLWLRNSFWILVINLNKKTASLRERTIIIHESDDKTIIRVEQNTPPRRRKKLRK